MPHSKEHKAKISAGVKAYHSRCPKMPKKKRKPKKLKPPTPAVAKALKKERSVRKIQKAYRKYDSQFAKPTIPKPSKPRKPKPKPKASSSGRAFPLKPEKELRKKIRYTEVDSGKTAWGKFGKRLHEQYVASLKKKYSPAQLPTLENINKLKKGSVVVVQAKKKNPNSVKWERFWDGWYDERGRYLERYNYYDNYIGEEIIVDKVSKSKAGRYSLSGEGQQQMPKEVYDDAYSGKRHKVKGVPISTSRPIIYIKKY